MMTIVERPGCRIAFERSGSGPEVLFIQGVGVQGAGWRPQIDVLAQHTTCLWFDNRGIGRSVPGPGDAPVSDLSVAQLADDARAVLDAAGWRSAHVVGHSLGGLIALMLALDAKSRVRSLALLCTFASGRAAAPLTPRMLWLGLRSRLGTRAMRRRGFLQLVLPPGRLRTTDAEALATHVGELFGHDLADQPAIVSRQLRAMRAANATDRLAQLAGTPTLVVSARHDPIAPPAAGLAIATGIPAARYVELPDASHGAPITHATAINALLLEHIVAAQQRDPWSAEPA